VDINLSLRPGPRLLLHGSIRHRSTFSPRFHAKRYKQRQWQVWSRPPSKPWPPGT
jgi:hypothetical protein